MNLFFMYGLEIATNYISFHCYFKVKKAITHVTFSVKKKTDTYLTVLLQISGRNAYRVNHDKSREPNIVFMDKDLG